MNTVLSRLNVVFAYTLTVLAILTLGCFVSSYFLKSEEGSLEIAVDRQMVRHVRDFSVSRVKNDLGFLTFDLQFDVAPLFNWNVKELFLYLTAEYKSPNNVLNQVVLWDKIVLRGDPTELHLRDMNTKYYFFDDGAGLRGHENVTMTLSWNVIPNAGLLPRITSPQSYSFSFPENYATNR